MIVSRNGHTDLAKMLLVNPNINVNLQDKVWLYNDYTMHRYNIQCMYIVIFSY